MKHKRLMTLLIILVSLVFAAVIVADSKVPPLPPQSPNLARIEQLVNLQKERLLNIQRLKEQIAQMETQAKSEENEFWKLQGAVEELQKQDADTAKAKAEAEKSKGVQPTDKPK